MVWLYKILFIGKIIYGIKCIYCKVGIEPQFGKEKCIYMDGIRCDLMIILYIILNIFILYYIKILFLIFF